MSEEIKEEKKTNVFAINKKLEDFMTEQKAKDERVLNILEELVNKDKKIGQLPSDAMVGTPTESVSYTAAATPGYLPPKYAEMFEKYFDPADGFKATYDEISNVFTIEVPLAISNMDDAHKEFYKRDLRSKKVDQNNILGSIDMWSSLVAQNLKYNRRIKLK